MLKFEGEKNKHEEVRIVINNIDFTARNLTSKADLFLLFENAKAIVSLNSLTKTLCLIMNQQTRSR
jgi:hypothetical protein